jgi:hypothetical protein
VIRLADRLERLPDVPKSEATSLDIIEKVCLGACGESKPLSQFHKAPQMRDGRANHCKVCATAESIERRKRQRERMGDEAYRAHQALIVKKSRQKRGYSQERDYSKAQREALWALVDRHRREFDHLFLLARRGELESLGSVGQGQ